MAKFNQAGAKPAKGQGPIVTATTATAVTYEGRAGFERDAKSELFLLAVANMVGESTFYEAAGARDARFETLVRAVAVADPAWMLGFVTWLRGDANMRSASLVAAAEATKAHLDSKVSQSYGDDPRSMSRRYIDAALQRADEPGELLAYWMSRYGRSVPKPVKRGVADAVRRLYTEYNLLKYDTASHAVRFADVLDLTHPSPATPEQGALFRHALDRRHGRDDVQDMAGLPMVYRNLVLRSQALGGDWQRLLDGDALKTAGMTWEDVLSLAGNEVDKRKLWEALIPSMGYMALLRNLRNFDQAGVSDEVAETVAARLADPEQVAKSRQFPFRFYAAHTAVGSLRWGQTLEKALAASLANVPSLSGRTLVLVDQSPSMFPGNWGSTRQIRSDITNADLAKLFGTALAMRADNAVLVGYGHASYVVPLKPGDSVLRTMGKFRIENGTDAYSAAFHHGGHGQQDRLVVITDGENNGAMRSYEQAGIPASTPIYTWNIGGYRLSQDPGGPNRLTFGGLTDAAFRMVPLIEAGRNAAWPWL